MISDCAIIYCVFTTWGDTQMALLMPFVNTSWLIGNANVDVGGASSVSRLKQTCVNLFSSLVTAGIFAAQNVMLFIICWRWLTYWFDVLKARLFAEIQSGFSSKSVKPASKSRDALESILFFEFSVSFLLLPRRFCVCLLLHIALASKNSFIVSWNLFLSETGNSFDSVFLSASCEVGSCTCPRPRSNFLSIQAKGRPKPLIREKLRYRSTKIERKLDVHPRQHIVL